MREGHVPAFQHCLDGGNRVAIKSIVHKDGSATLGQILEPCRLGFVPSPTAREDKHRQSKQDYGCFVHG
jgi:hypothetical protein